jgi:small subunit ribosomal protein S20
LANSPQARKRARQAETHRQQNAAKRSQMRTAIKNVIKAIEAGAKDQAEQAYKMAVPAIDAMVSKGIAHKNKAARHKSRLNAKIRAMG